MKLTTKILILGVFCICISNLYAIECVELTTPPPAKTTAKTPVKTTARTTSVATPTPAKKTVTTISVQPRITPQPAKIKKTEHTGKAFEGKGSSTIALGIGGNSVSSWYPTNLRGPKGWFHPFYGTISVQGEFGVHKYVGVGFSVGVGASAGLNGFSRYALLAGSDYSAFWSLAVPVAVISNFHFYQLIQDKIRKNIHGDKIDIYVGANLGTGPGFAFPKKDYKSYKSDVGFIIFGGIQTGIKYYPKPNLGVFAEFGYGKSLINAGVSFKMK